MVTASLIQLKVSYGFLVSLETRGTTHADHPTLCGWHASSLNGRQMPRIDLNCGCHDGWDIVSLATFSYFFVVSCLLHSELSCRPKSLALIRWFENMNHACVSMSSRNFVGRFSKKVQCGCKVCLEVPIYLEGSDSSPSQKNMQLCNNFETCCHLAWLDCVVV